MKRIINVYIRFLIGLWLPFIIFSSSSLQAQVCNFSQLPANLQNGLVAWYRSGEGISPYVFLEYSNMQLGFSYDVATSRFRVGANPARSFEMSFQLRLTHHVDRMRCIRL